MAEAGVRDGVRHELRHGLAARCRCGLGYRLGRVVGRGDQREPREVLVREGLAEREAVIAILRERRARYRDRRLRRERALRLVQRQELRERGERERRIGILGVERAAVREVEHDSGLAGKVDAHERVFGLGRSGKRKGRGRRVRRRGRADRFGRRVAAEAGDAVRRPCGQHAADDDREREGLPELVHSEKARIIHIPSVTLPAAQPPARLPPHARRAARAALRRSEGSRRRSRRGARTRPRSACTACAACLRRPSRAR